MIKCEIVVLSWRKPFSDIDELVNNLQEFEDNDNIGIMFIEYRYHIMKAREENDQFFDADEKNILWMDGASWA